MPPSADPHRAPRPVGPAPIAPRPGRRRPWGEWTTGYVFVMPAVLVIGVFGLFPIGYALSMSVHRWRVRRGAFVGFDHFERTLGDPTGFFVFLGGVLLVALGHLFWTAAAGGRGRGWARASALIGGVTFVAAGIAVVLGFGMMQPTGDLASEPAYEAAFDLLRYGVSEPVAPGYAFVRDMVAGETAAIVDGADVRPRHLDQKAVRREATTSRIASEEARASSGPTVGSS